MDLEQGARHSAAALGDPTEQFRRTGTLGDSVYPYINYTKPLRAGEMAEAQLLDHPFVQRLRSIRQLQNAYLVFPTAEHSRFVHSVGCMHLAGRWADHLYESLSRQAADCPSPALVVETLRLAGLLHDVGHGPLSHFFDAQHSSRFGIDHEDVGQAIVLGPLAPLIASLEGSPEQGRFEPGERVDPRWVAYLMADRGNLGPMPRWVELMFGVMNGAVAADNLDYLVRDSLMLNLQEGVAAERIIRHSFIGPDGIAFHNNAARVIANFLQARLSVYQGVYYHPVIRSIDLQLKQIFAPTMARILPGSPIEHLDRYLELDDHTLRGTVLSWRHSSDPELQRLGHAWADVYSRRFSFHLAFEIHTDAQTLQQTCREQIAERVRAHLPAELRQAEFMIDISSKHVAAIERANTELVTIYDAERGIYSNESVAKLFERLPNSIVTLRAYARDPELAHHLAAASAGLLTLEPVQQELGL